MAVPNRPGHFDGVDAGHGSLHARPVHLEGGTGVERQQGGDALGQVCRRNYGRLALGELGRLLSPHHQIGVVGQQDDLVGGGSLDPLQNLLGGRVPALATLDNRGRPESEEELAEPLPLGNRHDPERAERRPLGQRRPLLPDLLVLGGHVLDLEAFDLTDLGRLGQECPGLLGVEMNVEQPGLSHHQGGVVLGIVTELGADLDRLQVGADQGELGAVTEATLGGNRSSGPPRLEDLGSGGRAGGIRLSISQSLAGPGQALSDGTQNHSQPEAPGVDDAGLPENVHLISTALDRGPGLPHHRLSQLAQVVSLLETLLGSPGGVSGDREHGALHRPLDRQISYPSALVEGLAEPLEIEGLALLGTHRPAPQNLRENYPGIAPGTHQRSVRGRFGHR